MISETDAARIAKLNIQMFYDESWKPIYFWVNRSKATCHRNSAVVGYCILLSAGASRLSDCKDCITEDSYCRHELRL